MTQNKVLLIPLIVLFHSWNLITFTGELNVYDRYIDMHCCKKHYVLEFSKLKNFIFFEQIATQYSFCKYKCNRCTLWEINPNFYCFLQFYSQTIAFCLSIWNILTYIRNFWQAIQNVYSVLELVFLNMFQLHSKGK